MPDKKIINNGYIKLHRTFKDWYGSKDPDRVSLWIHLLLLANHAPNKWLFKGTPCLVNRGQFITSRISLSEVSGVSQSKIQRLLVEFAKDAQIEQRTSSTSRLITILNYDKYQGIEQQVNNRRTTGEQQMNTNKKNKNVKNVKNKDMCFLGDFEEIWKKYPSPTGKKSAERHFKASVKNKIDWKRINKALDNYKNSKRVASGYIQNGSTWFNNWQDWVGYVEAKENEGEPDVQAILRKINNGPSTIS